MILKLAEKVLGFMPMSWRWIVLTWVALPAVLPAQTVMQGSGPSGVVRLFTTDAALLESQDVRKDLPCTVTPVKPVLGFDLKFHAGFDVGIPLKELAGSDNQLTMIFRVTPEGKNSDPIYLSHRYAVPIIEDGASGEAFLQGSLEVGEGKYHVDWMMRDRTERVCSFYWDMEATRGPRDKQVVLDIAPGSVQAVDPETFKQEPPVERQERETPLNIKVMVNFAPQNSQSATLQPLDTNALVSILRSISREPRIGKFSVVAFNMQEQKVIYRQEDTSQIDFPALGQALRNINLGTVDIKRLSQKHGDTLFLADLINQEVKSGGQADALIIAGPKVMVDQAIPQDTLKALEDVRTPVFYMNYNLNPQANPWRDAIGNAVVKHLKGIEYTISRPRDLFNAWTEIMGRIVKLKFNKPLPVGSSQ